MRKLLIALTIAYCCSIFAQAQVTGPFFTMVVTNGAAIGFDAATLAGLNSGGINQCSGQLEGGDIRYRYDDDAGDILATVGRPLQAPQTLTVTGVDIITRFRARAVAGDGTISWTCHPSPNFAPAGVTLGPSPAVVGASPTTPTYITQTPDATLTNEQALDALATGLLRSDTATGIITVITDSAGIAANLSDESGTGLVVLNDTPTLVTPILGVAASTTLNTGHGDNELFPMDQDLLVASTVDFAVILEGTNPTPNDTDSLDFFAATTSAELAGVISDEEGTGLVVLNDTPTLITPEIGAATGTSLALSGALTGPRTVEVVTVAKTPTEAESGEVYTNTGDGDGSTGTMPNDPSVTGLYYTWIATAAQTITLTASAGETLESSGSTCGTSITLTDGQSVTLMNATSGAGAQWHVIAGVGFTCNA